VRYSRLDHVGFSVANLDRSVEWYTFLFEEPPMFRKLYEVEYLSRVLGYPGAVVDAAVWQLPGEARFELLEYKHPASERVDMETYNVGNGHLCLIVDDLAAEYERLRGRAEFRDPEPVEIPWGHFAGGKSCYLRDPDGISIELVQYPPGGPRHDA
jgi:catechol 2,3-dioxygenase-like lactoylglutathione lyase family enzyme